MWNDNSGMQDSYRTGGSRGWRNRNHGHSGWGGNKSSKRWDDEIVFEDIPRPNKPRKYTVSIAVPASILEETCVKDELRTYVVGQIARAATIYSVDEIVVYDDMCLWKKGTSSMVSKNSLSDLIGKYKNLLLFA